MARSAQRTQMHTPNLDNLAENGIRFQNAYTCQPVCGPARSALFTGLYPHSTALMFWKRVSLLLEIIRSSSVSSSR